MRAIWILQERVVNRLGFMHRGRRRALRATLVALVRGGTATVTAVGRARAGKTTHKHGIKAADRFVGNKHLHDEQLPIYQAMASVMLARHRSTLVVLVDWTQLGAEHYKLTATVAIAGRSLAIFSVVVSKHCLASREVHEAFLWSLQQIVPRGVRRVVVVTDAGFESTWFEQVQALGWEFIGRVRHRTMVRLSDEQWVSNKDVAAAATDTPEDLGWMEFTKARPMWARFIRYKEPPKGRFRLGRRGEKRRSGPDRHQAKAAAEPWLLATSLRDAHEGAVVAAYRQRMRIEEFFRDEKNDRWGWGLTKVVAREASSQRLEVLALLAALATLAMTLLGLAAERRRLHRGFQANTVRRRRVLSLFVLGTLVAAETMRWPPSALARAVGSLQAMIRSLTPAGL